MTSESSPTIPSKFFTHNSTILLPSHPTFKYIRATPPSHFPIWLPIICSPSNSEFLSSKNFTWTPSAIAEWESSALKRYQNSLINHNSFDFLIYNGDEVVGLCNLTRIDLVKKGVWNIGLVLNESARRKGIGSVSIKVMAQVVWDWIAKEGERVEAGTMKGNLPFRTFMKRMGVQEIEEEVVAPSRGVVAEVIYHFDRGCWEKVEMDVQFGEELPGKEEAESGIQQTKK